MNVVFNTNAYKNMAIVICYAIIYPCGSDNVEDAIILNLGIQGTPVPLFYEALIGDHFTSSAVPFTLGTQYYVDSICCSASCLVGFPGPYSTAPASTELQVTSGACVINSCVGTLIPCEGGDPIYLRLGQENQFVQLQWLALEGQLLTFSTPGYSGVYYLSDVCCSVPAATLCGIDQLLMVPPPTVDENLGEGPCFDPPTPPTCCGSILPCDGGNPITVYIGTDTSSEYDAWDALIGNTITIDLPGYIGTFIVDSICCIGETIIDPCLNSAPCLLNSVIIDLADVTDLGPIPCPIPCYALTNCKSNQTILTSTNLWEYVNSVITIEEYPGCWQVSLGEGCVDEADVTLISGYDDCECCLPPVPPKYTRIIPAPNRVFYKLPSQCDVTTNVKFANAYYNIFRQIRYGIAVNCEVNEDRILIKKELNDLAAIYDATACISTTPPVPIICPEPPGNPFIPPPPPVTYTFTVGAYGIDPGTFGCTTCLDGSAPLGGSNLCPQFNLVLDYNILDTLDIYSAYVFNYNGNCLWAIGFTIIAGSDPTFQTYTMTSANITSVPLDGTSPCLTCGG